MTIKASELIETVKKLGTDNPEKKAQCTYFHGNGRPNCIVGSALYEHGIKKKDLRGTDIFGYFTDFNDGCGVVSLLEQTSEKLGIELDVDSEALQLLEAVQGAQDDGLSWGSAIKRLDPDFDSDEEED